MLQNTANMKSQAIAIAGHIHERNHIVAACAQPALSATLSAGGSSAIMVRFLSSLQSTV